MSNNKPTIAVIAGGLSHERDISLQSGNQVATALQVAGYPVEVFDVDTSLLTNLKLAEITVVFPVLHGHLGEDGAIQSICESMKITYVGSTAAAAHIAFDKFNAKHLIELNGINTPQAISLTEETIKLFGAANILQPALDALGFPLVVKPQRGGSSLGLNIVRQQEELTSALMQAFAYDHAVLLERFIAGKEISVAVLDGIPGWQHLPPVEIHSGLDGYDYAARYTVGESNFLIPAELNQTVIDELIKQSHQIHKYLGLRDYSRNDFIVDEHDQIWFLESNISPGMTENSLLTRAVAAQQRSLSELCDALVQAAIARKSN